MLSFSYSCSFNHKQIPGFAPVLYKEFISISKKISLLFFILHEVPFASITLQDEFHEFQLPLFSACKYRHRNSEVPDLAP
jgi:hypothetical protein